MKLRLVPLLLVLSLAACSKSEAPAAAAHSAENTSDQNRTARVSMPA